MSSSFVRQACGFVLLSLTLVLGCERGEAEAPPERSPSSGSAPGEAGPAATKQAEPPTKQAEPAPEPELQATGPRIPASAPLPIHSVARLGSLALRHEGIPGALAFAPDASSLASADEHALRVWSNEDASLIRELAAPRTLALAYSEDGETLISAGADGHARMFELATGEELANLDLFADASGGGGRKAKEVGAAAFSTPAGLLAVGRVGGEVAVWDLVARERVARVDGPREPRLIVLSPDASLFALATDNDSATTLTVYAARTGALVHTIAPQPGLVTSVAFRPDNGGLVIGTQTEGVQLWDLDANALASTLDTQVNGAEAIWVDPSGRTALVASPDDHAIHRYNLDTGAKLTSFTGHGDAVTRIAVSADTMLVASTSRDRRVRVFDLGTAAPRFADTGHGGPVTDLAWAANGERIATASTDGEVRLWDTSSWTRVRTDQPLATEPSPFARVALSADAGTLVANGGTQASVFDAKTGALRQTLAHEDQVFAVAVSPDGTTVASGGADGLRLWSAAGVALHHLEVPGKRVTSLGFGLDGASVASGWDDGRLRIVAVDTGAVVQTVRVRMESDRLAYDGARLAARADLDHAKVFDAKTGALVSTLPQPQVLALGMGGNLALTTGGSGDAEPLLHIVDVGPGQSVREYAGHRATITAARFGPDGNILASASADTTVLIWIAP